MASLQTIKSKGISYYAIVECRRIKGKPTPVTIAYLGNVENILKMYNDSKYSYKDAELKSYSYGAVYALWKMAEKHNIIKMLNESFPERTRNGLSRGKTLLLASIYRAVFPGSKNEFCEKINETVLPALAKFKPEKMTSQHFWAQMDGISEDMIYVAEDKITEHILEYYNVKPGKLALDYTNYFTYIDSNNDKSTIAKRGHNKQKRHDLRQFSLGLVTTKELAIPLCSYVYEGNITDVVAFPDYLDLFKNRLNHYTDAADITLIYDNGSVSKKNLEKLSEQGLHYICAFSIKRCKDLYDIPVDDYEAIRIYDDKSILCYRISKTIWGKRRECILTYSDDLYKGQYDGLIKSIKKKKQKLEGLKSQIVNPKSRISKKPEYIDTKIKKIIDGDYGNIIFNINKIGKQEVEDIDISIDNGVISEVCSKYYGKKLLITDQDSWSTEEIIEAYWDQFNIEHIFKDSKNRHHFSIQPQFHWTDSKVRVHTFCCLLGLLLTSLLKKELADAGIKIDNAKLIDILSGIREVYILTPDKKKKSGLNIEKKLEQMSSRQQKIWDTLNDIVFKGKK